MVLIKQNTGLQTSIGVMVASTLVVAVQLDAPAAVKTPLGLLVAVILPGWLGFCAVRGHPPRTLVDAALSLIGSVGFLMALGIFLDLFDAGLTPEVWSLGLLVVSVVLTLVAAFRQVNSLDAAEAEKNLSSVTNRSRGRRQRILTVVQLAVSAALLGLAAIVTLTSQRELLAGQGLTELWLSGDSETQLVQVLNREGGPIDYRITVSVQGEQRQTTSFRLADGEEWTTTVNLPERPPKGRKTPVIAVSLYRGDEVEVYRKVHFSPAGP